MMKKSFCLKLILTFFSLSIYAEEGMFPLSELKNLDLKKAGLRMDVNDLYNPDGVSLIDALVRIGGCTGSFISKEGLIITNHHCVYGAVAEVSDTVNNYLKNGFHAATREKEIPVKNLTVKITMSYKDISDSILFPVANITDATKRLDSIRSVISRIEKEENKKDTTLSSEISEMFVGKTYVLFKYKIIKDIRLVYVPPVTIGNFGGETDNWVWPRHTGDFSIVRAYVDSSGSAANYSEKNIPFHPKNILKINPSGVNENDFVFILGYPGRTMRHHPSQFLEYQQKYVLPFTSGINDWQIDEMLKLGKNNVAKELRFTGKIKGLANVSKNYKGKIQGLSRTNIIQQKKSDEEELKKLDGKLFEEIDKTYQAVFDNAQKDLWLVQLFGNSNFGVLSQFVLPVSQLISSKTKDEKEKIFKNEKQQLEKIFSERYANMDLDFEKALMKKLLGDAMELSANQQPAALKEIFNNGMSEKKINETVEKLFSKTKLKNWEGMKKTADTKPQKLFSASDVLLAFYKKFYKDYLEAQRRKKEFDAQMSLLMPKLLEVKAKYQNKNFIPDANSTLRLTYGYVKGYEPEDAVYQKPFTTLKGEIEKGTASGDYEIFPAVKQLYSERNFGKYISPQLNDVPLCLLYNLDTTGGNSGSPIMNANGELIGVNFDRAFSATINDYAWNEKYSRSIAVDIRYVLWILEKVGKADNVLNEIGIN